MLGIGWIYALVVARRCADRRLRTGSARRHRRRARQPRRPGSRCPGRAPQAPAVISTRMLAAPDPVTIARAASAGIACGSNV